VKIAAALFWGTLFGAGLEISGMTNPAKVLAFLDVFGHWDATLAFVMGAALAVSAAGYQLARRRDRAWLGSPLEIPTRRDLDGRLLGGAALFGVGWGLVGLCPGPALANLARGSGEIALFVAAMLAGVGLHRFLTRMPRAQGSPATI
jgi:uncharacterized membrane protein YedE/YeeE